MPPDITTLAPALSPAHRRAFEEDGFFRLERAFDLADAGRMEDEWWAELADKWGWFAPTAPPGASPSAT